MSDNKIPEDISITNAIALLEWLGYKVIPAEDIKTVSFHVVVTDEEMVEGYTQRILDSYAAKKEESFKAQIEEFEAIKYTQRADYGPNSTIHSWKMKVIV